MPTIPDCGAEHQLTVKLCRLEWNVYIGFAVAIFTYTWMNSQFNTCEISFPSLIGDCFPWHLFQQHILFHPQTQCNQKRSSHNKKLFSFCPNWREKYSSVGRFLSLLYRQKTYFGKKALIFHCFGRWMNQEFILRSVSAPTIRRWT